MSEINISINQIVAIDENGGIGINGNIPWSLPKDWEHFLRLTTAPQVNEDKLYEKNGES